jgi:hypothetical protein
MLDWSVWLICDASDRAGNYDQLPPDEWADKDDDPDTPPSHQRHFQPDYGLGSTATEKALGAS